MSQADEPAEHRLHWLLDALHTGPRFRGDTFDVAEHEVRGELRAARDALDRGEITVPLAVDRLLCQLARHMDERRATRRRAPARRAARTPEHSHREVFETSAGAFVLPRRHDIVSLEAQPPWLLCETSVPCRHQRKPDSPSREGALCDGRRRRARPGRLV